MNSTLLHLQNALTKHHTHTHITKDQDVHEDEKEYDCDNVTICPFSTTNLTLQWTFLLYPLVWDTEGVKRKYTVEA